MGPNSSHVFQIVTHPPIHPSLLWWVEGDLLGWDVEGEGEVGTLGGEGMGGLAHQLRGQDWEGRKESISLWVW